MLYKWVGKVFMVCAEFSIQKICDVQTSTYGILYDYFWMLAIWKPTLSLLPTPKQGQCCICWWGDCMNTAVCKTLLCESYVWQIFFFFSKKIHYKMDNNYISLQDRQTPNVVNIVHSDLRSCIFFGKSNADLWLVYFYIYPATWIVVWRACTLRFSKR